ncbi:MAG: hypothetical protein AABX71_02675 [Nanoarchaeota archaeon]
MKIIEVKNRNSRKKSGKVESLKASKDTEKLNSILVENFVSLQKALTNLSFKFDRLSDNISTLLQLFEISAKSFSEKLSAFTPEIEKDREFLDKLNALLEQNKVIARGLTLMEEKMRERLYGQPSRQSYPVRAGYQQPSQSTKQAYTPSFVKKEEE